MLGQKLSTGQQPSASGGLTCALLPAIPIDYEGGVWPGVAAFDLPRVPFAIHQRASPHDACEINAAHCQRWSNKQTRLEWKRKEALLYNRTLSGLP